MDSNNFKEVDWSDVGPELLAALRDIVNQWPKVCPFIVKDGESRAEVMSRMIGNARAAIAKANRVHENVLREDPAGDRFRSIREEEAKDDARNFEGWLPDTEPEAAGKDG